MFYYKIRECQMSHNCLVNSNLNFHTHLLNIDIDLAQKVKEQGCPHCGGKLHQANYPRTAFGVTAQIAPIYACRFSYCCANCRRRTTPPCVRFFGRRRYVATIFILLCASRSLTPDEACCTRLARRFGCHLSVST